jgi:hypothetical protein
MTSNEALEHLDDVPWAEVQGEAIPGLLRGVLAGEPDALGELQQEVVAGGVIWEASSYVVPFLARLAVAGVGTLGMLDMLGWIAGSDDEVEVTEPGRARREFAAQVGVISALRDHDDPWIRAALAWALAQDPDGAAGALAVLQAWWEEGEADPSVRCTLLRAMLELDPAVAASLAVAIDGDPRPDELLIAAWACAAGGEPWTPLLHDAATAWVTEGLGLPTWWWRSGADRHDPFAGLLRVLAARGDAGIAAEVAADALAQVTPARQGSALQDIVWAIEDFAQAYRVPLEVLAVAVARAASGAAADLGARVSALSLLRELGPLPVAADLAHAIADAGGEDLAEDQALAYALSLLRELGPLPVAADLAHAIADAGGEDLAEDQALAYLIELGDPRAPLLLAAYLPNRPKALLAAAAKPEGMFCPDLLEAVRDRLRADRPRPLAPLLSLLHAWGRDASFAAPEVSHRLDAILNAILDATGATRYQLSTDLVAVADTLIAITGQDEAVIGALRQAGELDAARRVLELTGDAGPLLAVIQERVASPKPLPWLATAQACAALPEPGPDWLVPALRSALQQAVAGAGKPRHDFREPHAIALALWRQTEDATDLLSVLSASLRGYAHGRIEAANMAGDLGPAALPLLPDLLSLPRRPQVIRAILRIDPADAGGIPRGDLAECLVSAAVSDQGRSHQEAIALLRELDPVLLTPEMRERLRNAAERPRRVAHSGRLHEDIRADEHYRAAVRALLGETA